MQEPHSRRSWLADFHALLDVRCLVCPSHGWGRGRLEGDTNSHIKRGRQLEKWIGDVDQAGSWRENV